MDFKNDSVDAGSGLYYKESRGIKKPVAVNISFGNTYGSHDGTSLLERYLNTVSNGGKM